MATMKTLLLLCLLMLSAGAAACEFSKARYVYTGDPSVTGRFGYSKSITDNWITKRYLRVSVGKQHLYFLFDSGAARQISLISSEDPDISIPTPDGGIRPYRAMTYIAWDRANRVEERIPRLAPPRYFMIPELAENLAHNGPEPPIFIAAGIFELRCR